MNTHPTFKTLLLLVLLMAAGGFSQQAKAQEDTCAVNVIHTYMNGVPIPWDSVEVYVQSGPYGYQYGIFTLYWPDTILSNCVTGIQEFTPPAAFSLSQSFPNPCQGESQLKLSISETGNVNLRVVDLQGRLCCQRTEMLPAGEHQLALTLPHSGMYFVQAEGRKGRNICKVLCTEGMGGSCSINVSSTALDVVEKAERGGEGLFNMTDKIRITAHITHNGVALSRSRVVNSTFDDWVYVIDSLYQNGSVNIHFWDNDGCEDFSLSGQTFNILLDNQACQPFMDYPIGESIVFYDSTFYATPSIHSSQLSWCFDGWYKYRYYPGLDHMVCICNMNETLPPVDLEVLDNSIYDNYYVLALTIHSCIVAHISQYYPFMGTYNGELMVKEE